MTDRMFSWHCDGSENVFYTAKVQQPLPTYAPTQCVDYNNNSNNAVGLRYFNMPSYTSPPVMLQPKYPQNGSTPTQLDVCQYAHANGSASCYNRNRYMPYNHNRACAAAAAVAAVTGHPIVNHQQQHPATMAYNYPQSFAPIYQPTQLPPTLPIPPIASASISFSGPPNVSMSAATSPPVVDYTYANGLINTMAPSALNMPCSTTSSIASSSMTETNVSFSGCNGISGPAVSPHSYASVTDPNDAVTLQITNLDYSLDETSLRNFLMNQLKPITPVVSLNFEGSSYAKVTVPDLYFAKQVVSNLHRKKIGHKRMLVSYTRDSSLTEVNTLRCQVAGLLKDVPYYTLPMYKFRELFQSRFKTSICVLDLYKMQDICTINSDNNEEKIISLQPELVRSLENSPLMEGLQHSVPYCTVHFKREQHKGWAEQEIEPLPNVCMTIAEIQQLIYPLLKQHPGDIPVATLVHCIEAQLKVQITANESGVNLEHLVCCVQGVQIQVNNFGIKILGWLELNKEMPNVSGGSTSGSNSNLNNSERGTGGYFKNSVADPLSQISREVIELVKMSPKSTMKFNRFIPAYHNHFGKQCRVADYGYTKLIELFEALSSVVQIMGEGENRQITLQHRTQVRRFTSDLLRVLRANGNNSVLLSQLPGIFSQTQNRSFDVTDYGVCDIVDILDGLVNSNIVVVTRVQQGKDILISIPKRKQTNSELEKISIFAGEMVELFQNALQYSILFQKFVRSYHYHFAYQCRLSDYGFLKLADLMDAIHGVVEMEVTSDEDKKIFLSPKVARRVFAVQCEDLIRSVTGNSTSCMKLEQVLTLHKKKYGYQMLPQTLGVADITSAIELLPYVEVVQKEQATWMICHNDDLEFRQLCYRACKHLLQREATLTKKATSESSQQSQPLSTDQFMHEFNVKYKMQLTSSSLLAMRHLIEIYTETDQECVRPSPYIRFLMSIVRLLEQRPSMYLHEIKSALECGIATTFEFGFPNLYSVIAAHEDLFTINNGPTQERSDVSLNVNCDLRLSSGASHQHLFGSLKLPYAKHKTRTARTPLGEHNRPPPTQAPPPNKMRAIANEYINSFNVNTPAGVGFKPQVNSSKNFQHYQENFGAASTTGGSMMPQKCSPPFPTSNNVCHKMQPSANSSTISSNMLNSTSSPNLSLCSSCNKENSLNSSLNLFNSSLNSSCELNGSLCSDFAIASSTAITAPPYGPPTKLWHRRQTNNYQQQPNPHQLMTGCFDEGLLMGQSNIESGNTTTDLYDMVSLNVAPFSSIYEPPKPDTPPRQKLPFWLDPVWSNQTDVPAQAKNSLLNIRLPEIKSLNVLPMLLSPYTLSKNENMKRQLFNFENHDRKIA
ncbi:meiosis regulator and mRNA stability factor 1 [Scaptodrosophila lebanonensis]|uniref:Meiosis regulator and mRNA stability factor 1 n=1 Tax=Drosophila lebanonensis TaxID=7225 RepID=A0A6J2TSI8_DROLE|nr:meiosis regulator and mRNA stability factor 1 [Scaptodrosophila lebanonensis]XP_030377882.1 meiosis regulator and mRNA stability factor 1 [Scaptodrosophila lebanonensis]XP_030377883.1 meiosis regulator and mRNA stability factor 1 [Scaptodrosophila lebanonensis]XP_030377884.1 meiosis regulator and mRNA stability factor 1 [Scaptodrosophila lebanonensis]